MTIYICVMSARHDHAPIFIRFVVETVLPSIYCASGTKVFYNVVTIEKAFY